MKKKRVAAAPLLDTFFSWKAQQERKQEGVSSSSRSIHTQIQTVRAFDFFFHFLLSFVSCILTLVRLPVCYYYYCEKNKKKKKNGVVPNKVHQNRIVWTGETRHGAFTALDLSRSFSLSRARVFLFLFVFLFFTRGEKNLTPLVGPFLFVSVSVSLTFLYARIPLDASLTLFLSLLFSSIDRLERSWSPSG